MTTENRIAQAIIECLDLADQSPESFPKEALLFGPAIAGGLDLDSIASLEIISELSLAFDLAFDDLEREDMMSVRSLAEYVHRNSPAAGAA